MALGGILAVCFGVFATVASGEFRISQEFVLIDIPLAAVSTFAGFALTRQLQSVWRRSRTQRR